MFSSVSSSNHVCLVLLSSLSSLVLKLVCWKVSLVCPRRLARADPVMHIMVETGRPGSHSHSLVDENALHSSKGEGAEKGQQGAWKNGKMGKRADQ